MAEHENLLGPEEVREVINDSEFSLRNVVELYKTVSAVPTATPKSVAEQFVLYVNSSVIRFYWYDTNANSWRFSADGVKDHGDLSGLADDDHSQYILADGSRDFIGEQSMGTNKLTNVVDPTADQEAATKKYVDDNQPSTSSVLVKDAGVTLEGTNDTTEQIVHSASITGNNFGTGNLIRIILYIKEISPINTSDTITLRIKLGSQANEIFSTSGMSTSQNLSGLITFDIFGDGATNSQTGVITMMLGRDGYQSGGGTMLFRSQGWSSSQDSTTNLTFEFTIKWSVATSNTNQKIQTNKLIIYKIPA